MDRLQALEQQLKSMQGSPGGGLAAINGMMTSLLLFWLAWPVLCCVLGASRGKAMSGFMNGLFWGPLGLIPVLLAKKKYECPTCKCKTLDAPATEGGMSMTPVPFAMTPGRAMALTAAPPVAAAPAGPTVAAAIPTQMGVAMARRILDAIATPSSINGVPQSGLVTRLPDRQVVVDQASNVFALSSDEAQANRELDELLSWVNGGKVA